MSYRCCCIPVRVGVLVFSPVVLIISVLLTVLQFHLVLNDQMGAAMSDTNKALMGLFIALSLLVSIGSILGWLGAVLRKRGLVVFYGVVLWLNWLSMIGTGIAVWVLQDEAGAAEKQQCTRNVYEAAQGKNDYAMWLARAYCKGAYNLILTIAIMSWILLLLLLLGLCMMTSKYSAQLRNEAKIDSLKSEAEESCSIPPVGVNVHGSEGDASSVEYKTTHIPAHGSRGSLRYAEHGHENSRPGSGLGTPRGAGVV